MDAALAIAALFLPLAAVNLTIAWRDWPPEGVGFDSPTLRALYNVLAWGVFAPLTYLLAFPAGLGAKVTNPDKDVVVISGDGGFMFNVQEISTAVAHEIPVIVIVFADGAFGNVKRIQKDNYGGRHIAVELHNPDFVALAESFGMRGIRASTPEDLASAIAEARERQGPTLIEVPVGEMPSIWQFIKRPPSQGKVGGSGAG